MRAPRWPVVAGLLALGGAGCSDPSDDVDVASTEAPEVAAWTVGADVGPHFGPFPTDGESSAWFAVVLSEREPVDAFFALVEDAAARGFEATTGSSGACQQHWRRDVVALGDSGGGEGDGFQGETPFNEALPSGATIVAVACEAIVEGGGERVAISVQVPLQGAATSMPVRRPPIVMLAPAATGPSTAFRRQDVDLPYPDYASGPLTVDEVGASTLDELAPLVPEGVAWYPNAQGGCGGAVLRSASPPTEAVDAVVTQSRWQGSFPDPASDTTVAGQRAATRSGFTAGARFLAAAVETDAGSDVFICSIDN